MPQASLNCGVIGNCAFSALVDKMGRIVWCCLPRFDGDPVFNAILDSSGDGSFWGIELENCVKSEQFYDPNTAVLRTRLTDADNHSIEITDFAPRFMSRDRMFRPTMLVRRIRVLNSAVRIRVRVRPRFDWGRIAPATTRGSHHIRYVGPDQTLRLNTDASLSHVLSESFFLINSTLNFTLGPDETLSDGIDDTAHSFEKETINY
ncbi:MAG TPA: trehalase-like domain-containing protein, partial [Janthinobacterium sp.]|nr:trehalase-like domain-containing protein [Janthinobacterium sp.]